MQKFAFRIPSRNLLRGVVLGAVIVIFGALGGASKGWAQDQGLQQDDDFNKGGRTTFQFLKIGVGARQTALGNTSIAAVRDVNGAFWNPANIAGIESAETSFSYARWLGDMNYVAGAAGMNWDGVGIFALSIASLNYGDIQEALVSLPGDTGNNDTRTGNTVSGGDLMVGLTYARWFTSRLSIGIKAKFLREALWNYAVNSYAFDVGTNYSLGYKGTRLAMSVQNFSRSVQWLDESDRQEGYDVPLVFRIGASTSLVGAEDAFLNVDSAHDLTLSAEAINTNDYSERFHLGAEYQFADFLALRGGYRMNYAEGNWTGGFGLQPTLADIDLRVDYSYSHYQFLNSPHRFTISLAF